MFNKLYTIRHYQPSVDAPCECGSYAILAPKCKVNWLKYTASGAAATVQKRKLKVMLFVACSKSPFNSSYNFIEN